MPLLKTRAARRFTATIAAAATALALMTAAAVPARADNRDLAKALAIIAVIGLTAKVVHDNRKRDRAPDVWQPRPDWNGDRDRWNSRVLPEECAFQAGRRNRGQVVYAERCLRRAGVEGRLPSRCETDVRSRGRQGRAYAQQCLLNSGFRLERRRY